MTKQLDLPCGLEQPGARTVRSIELQKIKGRFQRELADLAGSKNPEPAQILDATLRLVLAKIGPDEPNSILLNGMLLSDRDWVIREAAMALRGPVIPLREACGRCPKDDNETEYPTFDLSSLSVTPLPDYTTWWVPGTGPMKPEAMSASDREAARFRCFTIENTELGVQGVFRYPTGAHQKAVAPLGDRSVEVVWRLMSMTCLSWTDPDNKPKVGPQGVPSHFWDDVDLPIVEWAQPEYAAAMPGVDTNVSLTCKRGHDHKAQVSLLGFLFRRPARPD